MKITLKDGSIKEYDSPRSVYEIAADISEGLARTACAAELDGEVCDLRTVVEKDASLNILTAKDKEGLAAYRHTTAHVLAEAVKRLFPEAKLTIGPSIDTGFYYDFDFRPFTRDDLDALEAEMKKIIKADEKIERFTLKRPEAIKKMEEIGEPYKVELINDLPEDAELSFYSQGDGFVDLCAGPHLMSTKYIKAFKLLSSSGAYWRGDEKKAMLQRIYGTAFPTKDELQSYLDYLEDIKKRDHNKIGREMELFTTVDVIGQGLPLFMPKGTRMLETLQRWIEDKEDNEWGYVRTKTPLMAKSDLYKISGHWDHYKDGMFILGDEEKVVDEIRKGEEVEIKDSDVYALRPMTCPFQFFIYKASQKSYRDLPIRMAETSTLFRNEDSGEMHGLTRVRQFTITEAHLIVRPDQAVAEFKGALALIKECLETLGLQNDVTYRLSKWDPENKEKYIGDPKTWEETEQHLRDILVELDVPFYEAVGEAAFYGPKVDINTKNVYGKEDTVMTVQWDPMNAERFDMYYIDQNGEKKRPLIIHRTSAGCYERTFAWLIEKYMGKFPTWLCPEQVRVLPISEKYEDYALSVEKELKKNRIWASCDLRSEKIGYKIREARKARVPYMLIVGEKEQEDKTVSVRSRFEGDEGAKPLDEFISAICEEIRTKAIREEKAEDEAEGKRMR
ncbi:MAG: threonine--tRNA ligase [Lachnospiraceae bacterium]|nr:threonine--tRNA ligase [Lachnospiraceae bacterium]